MRLNPFSRVLCGSIVGISSLYAVKVSSWATFGVIAGLVRWAREILWLPMTQTCFEITLPGALAW